MLKVCSVLPVYNERENIGRLIDELLAAATPDYDYMVLVVDDESPDGTADVVRERMARYNAAAEQVALLYRTNDKGLTKAIQAGIDTAIETYGADIVTWMDCDGSMPPAEVPNLVSLLIQDPTVAVAVGSRWTGDGADEGHGFMARTLSWIINTFAKVWTGGKLTDYTSGFVAARKAVLTQIRLNGDYGEYCIDILNRAERQHTVQEMPYVCVPRWAGESKTGANLWDYLVKGRKYVRTIVTLRRELGYFSG